MSTGHSSEGELPVNPTHAFPHLSLPRLVSILPFFFLSLFPDLIFQTVYGQEKTGCCHVSFLFSLCSGYERTFLSFFLSSSRFYVEE